MTRFKPQEERLSEHVGIRLTPEEKRIAVHMAESEGTTLTALIRQMLKRRAAAKGIKEAPEKPAPPRRGRPPKRSRR